MLVGVFYGGKSKEREVSMRSGQKVAAALKRLGHEVREIDPLYDDIPDDIQIAFLTTHGRYGEDGCLQGALELKGIPYTGSGVLASAVAMDKRYMKMVLRANDLPTPEDIADFTLPLVIKPACEGSSIGVERLINNIPEEKIKSLILAKQKEFGAIIVERLIPGRELTIGILGEQVLPVLELKPHGEFYDYESKYTPGGTEFLLPAPISKETTTKVQNLAIKAHKAMNCRGFSRIDIMLDQEQRAFIIDINTLPGLTDQSDLPAQAEAAGIAYDQLISSILESAFESK